MNSNDSTWLTPAWMQKALNAAQATFDVNPDLKRQMIEFLLDANLNPAVNQWFRTSELWALMKRFERFELFTAMAEDLGFEVRRRPSEERRELLLEQILMELKRANDANDAARAQASEAITELARQGMSGATVRVHATLLSGGASFSLPPATDEPAGF